MLHILPSISRSKSNQKMKLGQLIEYNKRKIFICLFFKTAWYKVKASGLQLSFYIFRSSSIWDTIQTNYKLSTIDLFKFNFPEKGLGLVSPPHFAYNFSRIMFKYSINWPNLIAWLPLFLEILGNMCVTIIC